MAFDPKNPQKLDFLPPKLNFKNPKFIDLLLRAQTALAELKGYSFAMPNPFILLSPAILRESLASSEIENIHTTIIEVLQSQLLPEREQRETDREVLRYRDAILWGFEQLQSVRLSTRFILGVQERLIPKSNRGYRIKQNAIANQTTGEILYTPPIAPDIPSLMQNWENFINEESKEINPLIKAAIAHYQFEAIHPFDDGNGRTGRMLVVLHLVQAGVIRWPILYISDYLLNNRSRYYQLLREITQDNKWDDFILFMLDGLYYQATKTKDTLFNIMNLFEMLKQKIRKEHRKFYSADLVEALFSYPVITPVKLSKELGIHYTTASRYLMELKQAGILVDSHYGKYHLFANKELLSVMTQK